MHTSHVNEAFELTGCGALVTGGTRGIGRAIAQEFAQAGAHVVVTGRDRRAAKEVAEALRAKGGSAAAIAYDAGQPDASRQLIDAYARDHETLDLLINNAAILRPHSVGKLSEAEFDEVFQVNTKAALFLCQAAHPLLSRSPKAAVVNLTAACAHRPMRGLGAYCASKAAMINFTSTLAQEWARDGIRVNALTPGSVATDMILPTDPEKRVAFEKEMGSQNLLGRLAEPREIARVVRFLASPAASFITGQTLIADGGLLA